MNNAADLFPKDAVWIGSAHPFDLHEVYLDFRSPPGLRLDAAFSSAELRITADSRYRLWVNGRFVARGPARSWPWAQQVDALDLSPYLVRGENCIAVQVYQPGYSHFSYVHRAAAGVLAALFVDGRPVLCTGNTWKVRRSAVHAPQPARVSIYGSAVEILDLAQDDGWQMAHYDDGAWAHARTVATAGGSPWSELKFRSLPYPNERLVSLTPIEVRNGPCGQAGVTEPHAFVRRFWPHAERTTPLHDSAGWIPVRLDTGEAVAWLCDLGRDYTCQGVVEVRAAGGAETLLVSYAEKLHDGELVISDPNTYCRVQLTDCLKLRAGDQCAETFTLRGGRYILFVLLGPTGADTSVRFFANLAEYPLPAMQPLNSGDVELDAIAAMCENTLRACMQETFVDCVWRESSQWLGDALPEALVMSHLTDDVRPLLNVISMAADGAYPDGVLPSVTPGEVHAYTIVDYNFMWIELLELALALTGDTGCVLGYWPILQRMLHRFAEDVGNDGLIMSQPGRRLFLDWAPVSRNEPNAIYNLHYLLGLQKACALANQVGHAADATVWNARAEAIQRSIRQTFWDGVCWWDDQERTTYSQLGAAFAVLTQSLPNDDCNRLLDMVVQRSMDPMDEPMLGAPVLASPFMHHYLFEALHAMGRPNEVVNIIRLRWGRWARAGYPTTWENWNVDFPDGSQCHAFSAHPRHHLAVALAALRTN